MQLLLLIQVTPATGNSSKYCGTKVPDALIFDATYIVLTFISDYSVTESGFKITYKVLSRKGY